ncbi:hypothetical protein GYMLUDRAFT_261242 [Collybiopsis luxurians FD-317 M1]|uniref:Uncharacterized protein n=1 Tax=Collybiopsis luxurians FD-317 M1 TaxID=944289 RepID=A0A0D0CXE3_9AGAR|nr:hypothetical protein GYMLUDRAFT_261242 [Collybiopsis luxurians FD-317 M1]
MFPGRRSKQNNRSRPYTTTRPSFFPHSHNFAIYGGVFIAGDHQGGSREAGTSSSNDIPKISRNFVRSQRNLRRQDEWIFSIGEQKDGKLGRGKVIIQAFVGRRARQLWQSTINYAQLLVHPNLLNIVGTSSDNDKAHYILFDAAQQNNACQLIAAGLRLGERETNVFGTRIVYGIASGLDFLTKINSSLSIANFGIESFDVFSDDNGNTVLAFTPQRLLEQTNQRGEENEPIQPQWVERNTMHLLGNKDGTAVFNYLITKLFSDANHIVYRDKLDRDDDDDDLQVESFTNGSAEQRRTDSVGRISTQESSANPAEMESITCRREVNWKSLGLDMSLANISETYEDILHCILPMKGDDIQLSIDLPRRSGQRRSAAVHTCMGYRREEITFTPDAVQNIILVFEQPSKNEICSQCGQVIGVANECELSDVVQDREEALGLETTEAVNQQFAMLPVIMQTNSARGVDVLLPGNVRLRSSKYDADYHMHYSYVSPEGEVYDISHIVKEWREVNNNCDVLESFVGRRGGVEELVRVLNKVSVGIIDGASLV